jgi:hypothetical protein
LGKKLQTGFAGPSLPTGLILHRHISFCNIL